MITIKDTTICIENTEATLEDKIEIEKAMEQLFLEGADEIYLDLSQTNYLPSELVGLLMWKKKSIEEAGKSIIISKISHALYKIFENALLVEFFNLNYDYHVH